MNGITLIYRRRLIITLRRHSLCSNQIHQAISKFQRFHNQFLLSLYECSQNQRIFKTIEKTEKIFGYLTSVPELKQFRKNPVIYLKLNKSSLAFGVCHENAAISHSDLPIVISFLHIWEMYILFTCHTSSIPYLNLHLSFLLVKNQTRSTTDIFLYRGDKIFAKVRIFNWKIWNKILISV